MSKFMDKNFLLNTKTSRKLYFDHASKMPIIDYHCHVSPKEIYEDKHFANITELWLSGEHYKWRLMRSNGVDEHYITGNATPYEKFEKFAELLPKAIGNPMYHWCHLELKNYFGYNGVLNGQTAKEVWQLTERKLKEESLGVRDIIRMSNVDFIGTTDDPIDNLEYHKLIAEDASFKCKVLPAFRPDKALGIELPTYLPWLSALENISGEKIDSYKKLVAVLKTRIDFFEEMGCKASDHGFLYVPYNRATEDELEAIFAKALNNEALTVDEQDKYKTELFRFFAKEYAAKGWGCEIHIGPMRNNNTAMFNKIGPDTGFDSICDREIAEDLSRMLDSLEVEGCLPKTILFCLNPKDNYVLGTMLGNFQSSEAPSKIQFGSGWWFNDNIDGMREQMKTLGNLGVLGKFVGMVTDSRSFLSYPRHEYFRRILCGLIGEWVEGGEYPNDEATLGTLVSDVCYGNAKRYFGL